MMKLLFDQNISFRIIKKLQNDFPGCLHVSDCKLKDRDDTDIWQYARDESFVIVTFDSDFYDISLINGHPPKIIWIRTENLTTNDIAQLIINKKNTIVSFLDKIEKGTACLELDI